MVPPVAAPIQGRIDGLQQPPFCRVNSMNVKRLSLLAAALSLASCASTMGGQFEPACIAYEGDSIEMVEGRFEWRRFTDQVMIDDDGNKIDPFPDYPISGTYTVQGKRVTFVPDGNAETRERYLLEYRQALYLLTYEENEAALDTDIIPSCALVLKTGD